MDSRIAHSEALNQLVGLVGIDMVFVAVMFSLDSSSPNVRPYLFDEAC